MNNASNTSSAMSLALDHLYGLDRDVPSHEGILPIIRKKRKKCVEILEERSLPSATTFAAFVGPQFAPPVQAHFITTEDTTEGRLNITLSDFTEGRNTGEGPTIILSAEVGEVSLRDPNGAIFPIYVQLRNKVGPILPSEITSIKVTGSSGPDTIIFPAADLDNGFIKLTESLFNGNGGDDTIHGTGYEDTITGGGGDDLLLGGDGDDLLLGDIGNDTLSGNEGMDTVVGGSGEDTIGLRSGNKDTLDQDPQDKFVLETPFQGFDS